jgi:alanine racemase
LINKIYNLEDVAKITEGEIFGERNEIIKHLYYDTRTYVENNSHLFIAIKTQKNDGHLYIDQAYKKGIRLFLVNKKPKNILPRASYIVVKNTIDAIQKWAQQHRKNYTIPVLAITGSYGKTIVKEWIYHILRKHYKIIRSPKSFNSQIGAAFSLLAINDTHEIALIETGISSPGEMDKLKEMVNPTHVIITNIGKAHLDNFESIDQLTQEKEKILNNTQFTYLHKNKNYKTNLFSDSQKIRTIYLGNKEVFTISQKDEFSANNFACCIGFLEQLKISTEIIKKESINLPEIALRMEKKEGIHQSTIINDSYLNDLPSLKIALEILKSESEDKKTTLILSDLPFDFSKESNSYKELSELIVSFNISQLIAVGKNLFANKEKIITPALFFETSQELIKNLKDIDISNHFILVKGNKEKEFQKIAVKLEAKKHQTTLEINLENIEKNYLAYQKLLTRETKNLVMIKAAGYGTGLVEIGKKLSKIGVDFLGVAYSDEGVELRNNNVSTPILVMNVEKKSMEDVIEHQLTPAIHDLNQLNDFTNMLIGLRIKKYPVHIKINTGMNRMGIELNEVDELIEYVSAQPEIQVEGVFSHLAASDLNEGIVFTTNQIKQFKNVANKIENSLEKPLIKHLLNTSGIENYPKNSFDMVRLGIGLYGISKKMKLENVATLNTKISKIRIIPSNKQVGYGTTNLTTSQEKIGIIPIGYADGFSRALGNGVGKVFVNGQYAPTFGNICMDMSFINLKNIDAEVGDIIEVFGENNSIIEMADSINTIPYEILSSISQRVVRIYSKGQ